MFLRYFTVTLFLIFYVGLSGQVLLTDLFIDGDLTDDPTWIGDIADYTSTGGILQLAAAEAGTSSIFTPYERVDSVAIQVSFDINTNPSGGNFSRIYLFVDNTDLSIASGYYLQLGEGGSGDAIDLMQLTQGQATSIARGDMGGIASKPSKALSIDIRADGSFSLTSTDVSTGVVSEEIITVIDWGALPASGFWGFYNTYTRSNVANYSYSGLVVERFTPDLDPPVLLSAEAVDAVTIILQYDEEIGNITVSPMMVSSSPDLPVMTVTKDVNRLTLNLMEALLSSETYTITVTGVTDLLGNVGGGQSTTLQYAEPPTPGDLVINEILFNPISDGSDYVEIINISDKRLALDGLIVGNSDNGNEEIVNTDRQLQPGELALLTSDAASTATDYTTNNTSAFIESRLPSFNNDDGNVTLATADGLVIDAVSYDEDWHFSLLDDVDGVSLERIDPKGPSQSASNWQSAASSVGFGTPGIGNSAFIGRLPSGDGLLQLIDDTFSPDLDGEDEQIAIQYDLPSSGYVANAYVYDQRGHLLRNLYNQELLGISGILTWDGLDDGGRRLPVGPYIIGVQLFNLEGERIDWQAAVILATLLD